jgi:hypothetical protein
MRFLRVLFITAIVALTVEAECPAAAIRARQAGTQPAYHERQISDEKTESNDGPLPCGMFDPKKQFVDVRPGSGHEYRAPGKDDKRGPCPGLNAAANHGFISHDGITNILEGWFLFVQSR